MRFGAPDFLKWLLLIFPLIAVLIVMHRQRTARLGRLPRKGDAVRVGPYQATVLDVSRRRVQRLRLERVPAEVEGAEQAGDA